MKAIVIGSGIAGIASAIRLRCAGYEVTVLERNSFLGGKLSEKTINGYRFDLGPSLFTMPEFVEELFTLAGKNPSDYFHYSKHETSCHFFWEDGTTFFAPANPQGYSQEAAKVFGIEEKAVQNYLAESAFRYENTREVFLESSLHRLKNYFTKPFLKSYLKLPFLGVFGTLNRYNEKQLNHPKLVQIFNRFSTYNGSNPYQTPSIMSMIPHLEIGIGTYFPQGGMIQIPKSLVRLAEDIGVNFKTNSPVQEILVENNTAVGVRLDDTSNVHADIVVSNVDTYFTYRRLLPGIKPPKSTTTERSSSALIFYWGIRGEFPMLNLHNGLLSSDYKKENEALFKTKTRIEDPTIYIHRSCEIEKADAPSGCENWFVMVIVPSEPSKIDKTEREYYRKKVIEKIDKVLETNLEPLIEVEDYLDPQGIEDRTGSYKGALYGSSSNTQFSAFLRHPNFSKNINNLYFVGGSAHPGGGIPLCLMSAKIATHEIVHSKI